jgi:hypothetical protein
VQQLLIGSALSLIVGACSLPADREPRAYNVCLARHAQETALCEGPRQAYEVDASDIPRGPPPVRALVTYARWARLYHLRSGLCRSIPAQCLLPLTRTGRTFKARARIAVPSMRLIEGRADDAPKGALGTGG